MGWRRLFPLIFLFTCVDGFIANLLYPAKLPFLYKDIFILIVYFLFMTQEAQRHWVGKFKRTIGFGTWYLAMSFMLVGILQMLNPQISNILVGILGFKIMFFYWPLAILAYAYVDSLDRVRSLLRKIIYFAIPICLFGLYQFWADPYWMVETFGSGFQRALTWTAGGQPGAAVFLRVFGTFASAGQFTMFLLVNNMFIFALLFTSKNKLEKRLMVGCALLNFITLLATGTRAGLALTFIMGLMFLILCRRLWRRLVFTFILGISLYIGFSYLGKNVIARYETLKDTKMIKHRSIETPVRMFGLYLEKYPLGRGLGTATGASRHLGGEKDEIKWELVENQISKLQYETGIIGVILFYLFLIRLSIHWIKYWLKFTDPAIHIVSAALSSLCLITFGYSLIGIIDNPPLAIFLWAVVGIVVKLSTIQSL